MSDDTEKVAMDPKDPGRPRFTLQELRDVLHERNELKAKVFLLQEELAYYKRWAPAATSDKPLPVPSSFLHRGAPPLYCIYLLRQRLPALNSQLPLLGSPGVEKAQPSVEGEPGGDVGALEGSLLQPEMGCKESTRLPPAWGGPT